MDSSEHLHHQLLQIEDQFLYNPASWSSGSFSEQDFHLSDFDSQLSAIYAESFKKTMQNFNGEDKKLREVSEDQEACVSSPNISGTLMSDSSVENRKINSQRCFCSKIHPTVNVNSRRPLTPAESSEVPVLDQSLLPPRASHHRLQLQQSRSTCRLVKMANISNEITQAKRSYNLKLPIQAASSKRRRVEPRASCPPLKIRKEKLGDKIAALQQIVSPFGKTDTASVLMEAISYINFHQSQIEMLSHSYIKSYRCKNYKMMCQAELNEKNEEAERNLKTRGLCLVPLAYISCMPEDGGGGGSGIWPPLRTFNRRTF